MAASDRPSAAGDYGTDWVYAGFWIRVWASVIDTVLLCVALWPLLAWLAPASASSSTRLFTDSGVLDVRSISLQTSLMPNGPTDLLINWLLPAAVVILFWVFRSATPGKMLVGARIVDAHTGRPAHTRQLLGRYAGYYISALAFFLGFFWVGWDRRKQGWHDKLAGTVVVRRTYTARPGQDFSSTDHRE